MAVRRWLLVLFAPVSLLALPACVGVGGPLLPVRPTVDPYPPPVKTTSSKSHPTNGQFASIGNMQPGERIPLNPTTVADARPSSPIPDGPPLSEPPPTLTTETVPPLEPFSPLTQAFRAFQDNQPEKAIEHLKEFDKPNQELLLQLIPAVVQASKAKLDRPDAEEAANLARQFEAAASAIIKRNGFGVRKAAVCVKVKGFGVYDPVSDLNSLRKDYLYSLYFELENVPCLPDRAEGVNGYLIRLECEMRVTDEFGQTVEIQDLNTKTPGLKSAKSKSEFTRSPVRDFFLTAVMQTPSRPGAYTVTFEIRDPRTGRSVSKLIPFRVQ